MLRGFSTAANDLVRFVRAALGAKRSAAKELQYKLADAEKIGIGSPQYVNLAKQLARLQPAVQVLDNIEAAEQEIKDLIEMAKANRSEQELINMVREEITALEQKLTELEDSALPLLTPDAEDDSRNAILEVRAGVGGEEAALFASDLFTMYENYSKEKGWKFERTAIDIAEQGGMKEAIAMISGENVFGRLKYETGVHRVQRIPITVAVKKMQTSTATVAVLPEAQSVDVQINQADLRIDVYRASGAGGQHVNKTESAVRITHLPTGIAVAIQDNRSQHLNKAKAMKILQTRLYQLEKDKVDKERADLRKEQIGRSERFDRIRTYNFQQNRITDHRINESLFDAEAMIRGELLDRFIEILDRQALIESLKQTSR
jgi:peptide chain release factor 1